ncbi:MAG: preprotein translocase subunit SecE [Armatimonadota bacterium]
MPDGVTAKGAAKVKADKNKSDKAKADKSRVERKPDGFFTRLFRFLRESHTEVVKKAAWPTWADLKKSTAVVIVAVLIAMVWLGGLDFIMTKVSHLIGLGPR